MRDEGRVSRRNERGSVPTSGTCLCVSQLGVGAGAAITKRSERRRRGDAAGDTHVCPTFQGNASFAPLARSLAVFYFFFTFSFSVYLSLYLCLSLICLSLYRSIRSRLFICPAPSILERPNTPPCIRIHPIRQIPSTPMHGASRILPQNDPDPVCRALKTSAPFREGRKKEKHFDSRGIRRTVADLLRGASELPSSSLVVSQNLARRDATNDTRILRVSVANPQPIRVTAQAAQATSNTLGLPPHRVVYLSVRIKSSHPESRGIRCSIAHF